jgi:hypothetical protein
MYKQKDFVFLLLLSLVRPSIKKRQQAWLSKSIWILWRMAKGQTGSERQEKAQVAGKPEKQTNQTEEKRKQK